MSNLILLAQIIGAHGIRGDMTARVYADDADNLKRYGRLSDKSGQRSYAVTSVRMGAKGAVLRLEGVTDRTGAEALRGLELFIPRSALPEADDGSYYYADLVGLRAVTIEGTEFGKVMGVRNFGAGDLLEVAIGNSNETILIPFRDQFVPDVDIKGGKVVVVPPILIDSTERNGAGVGSNVGQDDEE